MLLHLLQHGDAALLLPRVVYEHALEDVARPEDLLGEDVQQQVVDGQVPLHAELPHLAQRQVDEVHVAAPAHILLPEALHCPHEAGLVALPARRLLEQLLVGLQDLDGPALGLGWAGDQRQVGAAGRRAAVEAPQGQGRDL